MDKEAGVLEQTARLLLEGGSFAPGAPQPLAFPLTSHALATDIARLVDSHPWYRQVAAKSGDPIAVRHGVSRLDLPEEILHRLTRARDERPALYRHTLGVAVVSHYLALCLELRQDAVENVVTAALCHDLGELDVDPAILAPGHPVTGEERRFIYVHPIAGSLLVRDFSGIHPRVAKAILQHQERLDGSGYPYGHRRDAIGLGARILAAADVSEAITARFADHRRLSTLLRLNSEKFDPRVTGLLHGTFPADGAPPPRFEREPLARRLTGFAALLAQWARLRSDTPLAREAAAAFLGERMYSLRKMILEFGFDPDSLEMPLALAETDGAIAAEMVAVVDELHFQLADLAREYDRTASGWLPALDRDTAEALGRWRQALQGCIDVGRN